MFSACNSSFSEIVYADSASRKEKFYCRACGKPLILKRGRILQPHFAHQSNESCTDGWKYERKTKWHIDMQSLFDTTEVLMEDAETGERHIADAVYQDIVFEFQHSPIEAGEVQRRTCFYWSQGYRVVWVVDVSRQFRDGRIILINREENVYNWSHASRMFEFLPFMQHPDDVRIILYWEDWNNTGYLNHIAWTEQDMSYCEGWGWDAGYYVSKPDLRMFSVGKTQLLDNKDGLDASNIFNSMHINQKRCQEISNRFFEERAERAEQFRV